MALLEYLGHATVHVELDGVRLLTDPLLRSRVAHLRRAVPVPELPRPDVVLVSHGHYDHLDLPSLRKLDSGTKIVVPRGLGARLKGFEPVEVEEGDELEFGRGHGQGHPRRARGRPAAAQRRPGAGLRTPRVEADLLRRRHRPLRRDGRARLRARRRARSDLGLGRQSRAREASRPRTGRRGGPPPSSEDRRPHSLGDVPPGASRRRRGVPDRTGEGLRRRRCPCGSRGRDSDSEARRASRALMRQCDLERDDEEPEGDVDDDRDRLGPCAEMFDACITDALHEERCQPDSERQP